MRAWLTGGELPPRDVLEPLLQDLAARHVLLAAARQVSQGRCRDVVHALRVAGAAP
ncbi:hypothetical protein [Streptomyces enissocaesilis]|uniref:Uncharacterized protein n=1 Tax=Streptomyces enissocaesilis TaxID=332589 RepID=A0ABP6JAT1_9ACTN